MSDREALAQVIHRATCYDSWEECLEDWGKCVKAAHAVYEDGYRKVEIVSQEFLDSLPDEAPGLLAAVREARQRLDVD